MTGLTRRLLGIVPAFGILVAISAVPAHAAVCGDGIPDPGELCDDGNLISGDGCDANCTPTACANSIVTIGEQCDDGNLTNGDGCSSTCQRELLNPVPAAGSQFGQSVAMSGSNAIVGVPLHDQVDALHTGLAYLFSGTTGSPIRTFFNPFPDPEDQFGFSVAAVGSLVLVGCPLDDTLGEDTGAAYLFDGASGALLRTFPNPNPSGNRHFGWAVAQFGSNVLIGAPYDPTGAQGGGIAYLFHSMTGRLLQVFLNPTPGGGDGFGSALASVGTNVVVGAPGVESDPSLGDAGAAYIFAGASGLLLQTLEAPLAFAGDAFGYSVAALGTNVLVGAPLSDLTRKDGGTVYLFNGGTGVLMQTIQMPSPLVDEQFGFAVAAIGPSKILAGAPGFKIGIAIDAGGAFVFDSVTGALLQTVQKAAPVVGDSFGWALATSGSQMLIGAPLDDVSGVDAGAVYYFQDTSCGNGVLNSGEICDDGNTTAGDGCDPNCTLPACGNGVVGGAEQCDDGNLTNGDGCSAGCLLEGACGDGITTSFEQCDDGNMVNGDGCDSNCTVTGCGNGISTAGEQCDEGAANGLRLCCSVACQVIDGDRDGVCDQDDDCPNSADPAQLNNDGDVFGNACDVCPDDTDNDSDQDGFCFGAAFHPPAIGGGDPCSRTDTDTEGELIKPSVLFGRLGFPLGDEKIRIRTRLRLGDSVPIVAPDINGVHIRVIDRYGVLVLDETIPKGAFSDATKRGWKVSALRWTYRDQGNPALHNGIRGVFVRELTHGEENLYAVNVQAKDGTYLLDPANAPLTVSIELNHGALPPGGSPGRNQCAETSFQMPSCVSTTHTVRCS